jgi:hypothetical protein
MPHAHDNCRKLPSSGVMQRRLRSPSRIAPSRHILSGPDRNRGRASGRRTGIAALVAAAHSLLSAMAGSIITVAVLPHSLHVIVGPEYTPEASPRARSE